ncbi:MAG: PH domain-containing protein [bacterium]|nr:PH domain-containing protein [bacterium]
MRELLLRLFRSTDEAPRLPLGAHQVLRVERASPGFLNLLYLRWMMKWATAIGGAVLFHIMVQEDAGDDHPIAVLIFEILTIIGIVVPMIVTAVVIRLDFELRWYVITDRSLLIREGIWLQRELSLSFANVQNVKVQQGPIERLFGVSTIQVDTAGGAGATAAAQQGGGHAVHAHSGYVRGVSDPEGIRDQLLELIRKHRGAGLGDHDDANDRRPSQGTTPAFGPDALRALREAAEAARELRRATARIGPDAT